MQINEYKPIEKVLSSESNSYYEQSWENHLQTVANKKAGGIWEFMNFRFGPAKYMSTKTKNTSQQKDLYYWELPTTKANCSILFQNRGPVHENIFFLVPKDQDESAALQSWKDFISQLEMN